MNEFYTSLTKHISKWMDSDLVLASIVFVVAMIIWVIVRKILKSITNRFLQKLEHSKHNHAFYYILKNARFEIVSSLIFVIAFYILSQSIKSVEKLFYKIAILIFITLFIRITGRIVEGLVRYTEADERFRGKPYRSFAQVVMLLVYIAVGIIAVCVVTEKSPAALLAGLGAVTAVVSLMFHETILSFVSSIEISAYDLIRMGDWIEIPDAEVNGEVVEVSLHTIKVKNWDNSISLVSTNSLLKSNFKNWRTMQDLHARRIKRSIRLDANSVKFVDEELKNRLMEFSVLAEYFSSLENNEVFSSDINKKHITNLEVFKVYAQTYLETVPGIRKDLSLTVYTPELGERGIVFEVYGFSSDISFIACEALLAKILHDFLASLPYFDLKPFQCFAPYPQKN